jgi:hypothetical protein
MDNIPVGYIDINYRTAYAFHKMRVSTCPIVGVGPSAVFDPGGGADVILLSDGIGDFIDLLAPLVPASTQYNDFLAWRVPDGGGRPQPVFSDSLGTVGTNVLTHIWDKATIVTWTWRTDLFGIMKLVQLDYPVGGFDAVTDLTGLTAQENLNNYVTNPIHWVRGQDHGVPAAFQQISQTLDEKLRRAYHMV